VAYIADGKDITLEDAIVISERKLFVETFSLIHSRRKSSQLEYVILKKRGRGIEPLGIPNVSERLF